MKRALVLLFAAVLSAACLQAQTLKSSRSSQERTAWELQPGDAAAAGFSPERLARLDGLFSEYMKAGKIGGVAALVARNGRIVYHNAFGYEKDAIFRIASQTKAITSVAVMMLVEEGKLLLDDPVSKYIPEFRKATVLEKFDPRDSSYTTVPARKEVTVRHLLTHTSGIGYAVIGSPEARALYAKAGIPVGFESDALNLAEKMKRLAQLPLMHQPGERYTYGLNTDMLGYLVEVASGLSLDEFFRERIFGPLGMEDTYFYLPEGKKERLATLYTEDARGKSVEMPRFAHNGIPRDYPLSGGSYFSGGAGLSSTAYDYALFMQMLLNGGSYKGTRLLSPHSVRLMTSDQLGEISMGGANTFGLGFEVVTERGSSLFPWRKGSFSWGGYFGSTYWMDPESGLLAIILTQESPNSHWGELSAKFKNMVYAALEE